MPAKKKDLKLLFVKPCLRPGGFTKLLPVGLASVMTYFESRGYRFTLLDIDIDEFSNCSISLRIISVWVMPKFTKFCGFFYTLLYVLVLKWQSCSLFSVYSFLFLSSILDSLCISRKFALNGLLF